jgi:acyl dehydratase
VSASAAPDPREGRFFEDMQVGDVYRCRFGRTVTEADNLLFTVLTMNTNPLHFDARYAAATRWGRVLVNSTFTLSLVVGMSVADVSERAKANLGWEEVRLPHPVYLGDTLYCLTEVLEKRDSRSHPDAGIVRVKTLGVNQDGHVVITLIRTILVYRRSAYPGADLFPEIRDGEPV